MWLRVLRGSWKWRLLHSLPCCGAVVMARKGGPGEGGSAAEGRPLQDAVVCLWDKKNHGINSFLSWGRERDRETETDKTLRHTRTHRHTYRGTEIQRETEEKETVRDTQSHTGRDTHTERDRETHTERRHTMITVRVNDWSGPNYPALSRNNFFSMWGHSKSPRTCWSSYTKCTLTFCEIFTLWPSSTLSPRSFLLSTSQHAFPKATTCHGLDMKYRLKGPIIELKVGPRGQCYLGTLGSGA